MLRLQHLSIVRGTRTLYDNVNLVASDGERIALVGENGSGKSSLFAAILGELSPESGTIDVPELVSEVAQSVEETDREALQYVLEGHAPLVAAQAEQFAAHESGDDMRIAAAAAHLAEINEGAVKAQALTIMNGLGFLPGDENRTVREFSGGWRNRLALARCLINPAQLLLLDEPTNHLDIDSLIWLEAWLKRLTCTVIIISHDREFLDRAVQTTWAVEDGTITRYGGNYSFYEMQRVQNLRLQEANRKAYERTAAHLKSYIERFRYKATKAVQVQSRIKQLEKIERIEVDEEDNSALRLKFVCSSRSGNYPVICEDVAKAYGNHVIFHNVNLTINRGEKVAFVGKNGEGKSTLVKCIMDEITDYTGKLTLGHNVQIGYFAQNQAQLLDENLTVFDTIDRVAVGDIRLKIRDILGAFMFGGEASDKKVKVLSGGERTRLAMIKLLLEPVNFLILDEPTNHLDMRSKDVLKEAIRDFDGTVIIVSHDRDFLDGLATKVYEFGGGLVKEHLGGIYDFLQKKQIESLNDLQKSPSLSSSPSAEKTVAGGNAGATVAQPSAAKLSYEEQKELNKRLKKLERRVADCEAEIEQAEAAISILEAKMATPEGASDMTLYEQHQKLKTQLDSVMEEWDAVSCELEEARK